MRLSQYRVGVLRIGRLVVFLFQRTSYPIKNTGGGTREMISDLKRSLRIRYFVNVMNERTSFASRAGASKGAIASSLTNQNNDQLVWIIYRRYINHLTLRRVFTKMLVTLGQYHTMWHKITSRNFFQHST